MPGTGLALNLGHRLASSIAGGGAASSVLEDPNGGGIVVFDPDEVTPWGGWTDWAEMFAAILEWQTNQVSGGEDYQVARTVSILVLLRNDGAPQAVYDVPGGVYPVAGPIVFVGGPSAAIAFQQLGVSAVVPSTLLRVGENGGDVSFTWQPAPILPDNPGPRFEFYGLTFHSAQNAAVWNVEPRAGSGDTAGALVMYLQDARLSVGAAGPGAMIEAGDPSLVIVFADRSLIQRDGNLSTSGAQAIPVLSAGNNSIVNMILGDRSGVLDFAVSAQGSAGFGINQDPTSLVGYLQTPSFPASMGGGIWPSVRPVLVADQLVNAAAIPGEPQQVKGAAIVLGQAGDNFTDGETFGWSIDGIPDLAWRFVAGAPAIPEEVQIQPSGAASFVEWANRINANAAAPYTATAITGTGINNHLVIVPKNTTIANIKRPTWGAYSTTAITLQEARFGLNPGQGEGRINGNEYGDLDYDNVTATIPDDANVDALGPTWGGTNQIPDGTIARCQLPTSTSVNGSAFQDYRCSFGSWLPADSLDPSATFWAAPVPTNVNDAIARMASLLYTLNGNVAIP